MRNILISVIALFSFMGLSYAVDYYENLNYSRNVLLQQRDYLLDTKSKIISQINALNAKLDKVNQYLDDNDRSLAQIEYALKNAK